jgi:hypothetical protein
MADFFKANADYVESDPDVVVVSKTEQWKGFRKPRENVELDLIVDPMIYRTADVFLRGQAGVAQTFSDAGAVWEAITRNIDGLAIFFDNIILAKNLPIIDYGITFDKELKLPKQALREKCNQQEEILLSVHICDEASRATRRAVLDSMKGRRPGVPDALAADLVREMDALEYNWTPNLSELGDIPEREVPVVRFLYGAALFSAFAQSAGVGHIFQPKRSKIYLAASLHADSNIAQDEASLYAKLNQIMTEGSRGINPVAELDGLPPFLPYLLSKGPKTPSDLLSEAFKLRTEGMVRDYRDFRNQLLREWRDEGRIRNDYRKQFASIAKMIQQKTRGNQQALKMGLGITATGVDVSSEIALDRVWGWIQRQLPGKRYVKLLTRLALSGQEYEHIDRHLKTIWQAA